MPPVPSLPIELRAQILEACDAGTLAIACRVSFKFLELASKPLYDHVKLSSVAQANLLFCDLDESTRSPSISHFLSLYRIRSITSNILLLDSDISYSRSRLPSGRLALELLRLLAVRYEHRGVTRFDGLFDPRKVVIHGYPRQAAGTRAKLDTSWSRLDALEMRDCIFSEPLFRSPLVRTSRPLRIVIEGDLVLEDPGMLFGFLGQVGLEKEDSLLAREGVSVDIKLTRGESSEKMRQRHLECYGLADSELFAEQWAKIVFKERSS